MAGTGCHQRDLARLERWLHANLVTFSRAKCKDLDRGQGNHKHKCRVGDKQIESSPQEKNLGVLVDQEQDICCQCVLTTQKTNHVLGCIQRRVGSRSSEVILPLYAALVRPLHSALGAPA